MRRKLLLLSALTCIAGGSALLTPAPAASQADYPICEYVYGLNCSGWGFMECTHQSGGQDWLQCNGYSWTWA
ncbi:MAG: hypothetical protein ABW277_20950 [Longimicrobiaceae bacterium]